MLYSMAVKLQSFMAAIVFVFQPLAAADWLNTPVISNMQGRDGWKASWIAALEDWSALQRHNNSHPSPQEL